MSERESPIAVIGGSGIYQLETLEEREEKVVETPFGPPSGKLICGRVDGRSVIFLPRHGEGHTILPHEINVRANIWALKSLGAEWLLSFSAVGSLKEEAKPRDVLVPDQLFDRTKGRPSTYFGDGIVGHIAFGEPFCPHLREVVIETCAELSIPLHRQGTYVCMEGPAFSTRAESNANRAAGFSVIGMTALPEAKLAREAEIAYATVALVTDYDCWHESEEAVTVEMVLDNLRANAENVKKILSNVVSKIPRERISPSHTALDGAIMTDRSLWPEESVKRIEPLVSRFL